MRNIPIIQTERLILRNWKESDIPSFVQNWVNTHTLVVADTSSLTVTSLIDVTKGWVQDILNYRNTTDIYNWVIELQGSGVIGYVQLKETEAQNDVAEIGYSIGKLFWSKGYASEAVAHVLRYCFYETELQCVEAFHSPDNVASGRVLQKCGMEYKGQETRLNKFAQEYETMEYYKYLL